ncbi:DUF5677 domain-containing protein [Microbacterium sp. HJ5]
MVDYDALSAALDEEPFLREAFELAKAAMMLVTLVAHLRTPELAAGLPRNHAIIAGHYVRMVKLMQTLVRQITDGHGGNQQLALTREFIDSVSTVAYLVDDEGGDHSPYDAYVMDSLVAEREFLRDVRRQVEQRGGATWPIEERIQRSIDDTLRAAGVREVDIPGRRSNGWPSAQTRAERLSPTAYAAYRTGSGVVHGTFTDVYKHHLDEVGDGLFEVDFRDEPLRPQPLLLMALLAVDGLDRYGQAFLNGLPATLAARRRELIDCLRRVDDLHEEFLIRLRSGTSADG